MFLICSLQYFRCDYPQSQTCPDGFEKIEITPTKFRCEGVCLYVFDKTNKLNKKRDCLILSRFILLLYQVK